MDSTKKAIVLITLIIGAAGIIGIVFYGLSLRVPSERESPEGGPGKPQVTPPTAPPSVIIPTEPVTPARNPLGLPIPQEVFYYTGTIKKISKNAITIVAAAKDNFLENDTELIVRIDKDTQLEKYSTPLYLPPGKSPKDYKIGTGTLADFKAGDRVTVHASTNIAGVAEFTARSVKAVEFSESGS